MWKVLEKLGEDDKFKLPRSRREVDEINDWGSFFTDLSNGVLQVPKEDGYLFENEFDYGIVPLMHTQVKKVLTQDIDLRYKIWLMRWGIIKDHDYYKFFGSAFFSNPDFIESAMEELDKIQPIQKFNKIPWRPGGPDVLLYLDKWYDSQPEFEN